MTEPAEPDAAAERQEGDESDKLAAYQLGAVDYIQKPVDREELVARIRTGDADTGPWRSALLTHLRETVDDKLEVARGPLRGED